MHVDAAGAGAGGDHRRGVDEAAAHPSGRPALGQRRRFVLTLIKPHYEADPAQLVKGVLPEADVAAVVAAVRADVVAAGFDLMRTVRSPILGAKGKRRGAGGATAGVKTRGTPRRGDAETQRKCSSKCVKVSMPSL
jgi:hypothetical protein